MRWELFCRVIDNYGDIGVGWRLAADLAARGESVRLWLDDASALRWMAPAGATGVEVRDWADAAAADATLAVGEVVVELFGCDPPPAFVERIATRRPVWINLEYLSAEAFVERNHALHSPVMAGPARGATKWFFHPGFTPATGGLLREPGLLAERERFDRDAWLAGLGCARARQERVVLVFCYAGAPLPALLHALAGAPTLVLLAQGAAQAIASAVAPIAGQRRFALPWLTQPDFDRALWAADLNCVRGEDSFVRAQWAGAPFVWQIYPQADGVHAGKLEAFMDRFDRTATPEAVATRRSLWQAWNGLAGWCAACDAALQPVALRTWRDDARRWRSALAAQDDLVTQLQRFAVSRRLE